jgi:nucleoid-associated protein YgaU
VNVYPNPSNGQFNVQLSGATSEAVNVRVLDAQGRYIKAVRSAGNGVITLGSDLKAGAYLLEVRQGNNVKVTRVLKF